MNKVFLVGRLGQDPEIQFSGNGLPICRFSVATGDSYKDAKGERVNKTDWHNVVVFGPFAEVCQMNLEKGHLVSVEGKLETRSYDAKDGTKKYSTNVVAAKVEFLTTRPKSKGSDSKTQIDFDMNTGEALGTQFAPDDIPF